MAELLLAVQHRDAPRVRGLFEQGADPNALNGQPLAVAVDDGLYAIVDLLLQHGARADLRNSLALIIAVDKGFLSLVRRLVDEGGANVNASDSEPMKLALFHNRFDIARALEDRGAVATTEPPRTRAQRAIIPLITSENQENH